MIWFRLHDTTNREAGKTEFGRHVHYDDTSPLPIPLCPTLLWHFQQRQENGVWSTCPLWWYLPTPLSPMPDPLVTFPTEAGKRSLVDMSARMIPPHSPLSYARPSCDISNREAVKRSLVDMSTMMILPHSLLSYARPSCDISNREAGKTEFGRHVRYDDTSPLPFTLPSCDIFTRERRRVAMSDKMIICFF